jgi:hypothetical protein
VSDLGSSPVASASASSRPSMLESSENCRAVANGPLYCRCVRGLNRAFYETDDSKG